MVIPAGGVTTGHVKVILVALTETPVGARWSGRLWYQHFPVGIHTSITPRESVTSVYVFPFIDKVRVLLLFLYRLLPGTSHIWNPSEPLRPLPEDSKRVFALSTVKLPSDSLESKFWSPWNSALIKLLPWIYLAKSICRNCMSMLIFFREYLYYLITFVFTEAPTGCYLLLQFLVFS